MFRFISMLIITLTISSCSDENEVDKLDLLTASGWLGPVEITETDYDSGNNLIDQQLSEIPEGQYELMILNRNRTAILKYSCDDTKCDGDTYMGTWELQDDLLQVWINREELGRLSDALFIEGEISKISSSELVVEFTFNNPTLEVAKRVRQLRYVSDQKIL